MENEVEQILQQWEEEKIELNPGAPLHLITDIEGITGFPCPEDFKRLYQRVNGFFNNDWRTNMFSVWPLEKIVDEYHNSKDRNFVAFADYLINSHQIGFVKTQKGIFKMYEPGSYFPVADTFLQAVKMINDDADLIYV